MTNSQNHSIDTKIKELVNDQRAFYKNNHTLNIDFRIAQLKKLKSLIIKHEEELHEAINKDFGKSRYENQLTELFPLLEEINQSIKKVKKWAKPKRVGTNLLNFPAKSYIVPEPLGVSLVIGAWNFPYNLSLTPVVGSIVAGNTTILKPSEISVHTSNLMAKIINDNFDSNYLHVVEGGIPETTALLNQRFDKIFFTGSPAVGKIVNKASAEHLTNVTLELGGKNPVIIDKNVSLNVAVKRMLWAKFTNAGQLCIAPDYVLVHKEIKEQFLKTVVKEIKKSNYSQENNNFVRIINEKNYNRLIKLIDENKIYYGGNHDRNELKIEPTILTNVSLSDKVMQEEIFGPILAVIDYDTTDEAFEIIKKMEKPLASYLYTNDKNLKNRFLKEIPFGSGGINESVMQISNPNLPFGGVGNSGIGSYHGKYSFNCFSHFKSIIDKPTFIELNLKHYGYNQKKINIFKKLF